MSKWKSQYARRQREREAQDADRFEREFEARVAARQHSVTVQDLLLYAIAEGAPFHNAVLVEVRGE